MIEELTTKNKHISAGLIDQVMVQERLQATEEYLRRETLLNEEQRATINILKTGLEANLHRLGIKFSNKKGQQNQIDGYLQLVRV